MLFRALITFIPQEIFYFVKNENKYDKFYWFSYYPGLYSSLSDKQMSKWQIFENLIQIPNLVRAFHSTALLHFSGHSSNVRTACRRGRARRQTIVCTWRAEISKLDLTLFIFAV